MITKTCKRCNTEKPTTDFYTHKTKKDGLQVYCKLCQKNDFLKELNCQKCTNTFFIKHRNISQRKTFYCPKCVLDVQSERIIVSNKKNAKYTTISKKGYTFNRIDSTYILSHRKVMEDFLNRKLSKNEIVHHIDGNKKNNNINNLFLTNNSGHNIAHKSLDLLSYWLIQNKFIEFDLKSGTYIFSKELVEFLDNHEKQA